jgi:hypothetical protein
MCHKDTKAYTVKSTKYKQFSIHVFIKEFNYN